MFPLAPLVSPHPRPHHYSVRFLGSSSLVFPSKVLSMYAYTIYAFNFQDSDCMELLVIKSSEPTMV